MSYQPEPKPPSDPQPYAAPGYYPDPQQMIANQWRQDNEHLQLLAILYYVMGGFATLGACIPLVYFGAGLAFIGGAVAQDNSDASAGMAAFGGLIMLIAIPFLLLMLLQIVCLFLTGRYLSQARNHIFCFINACLLCMHAPIGTALGIFTIVVLSRETVKQRFDLNRYGYQPPKY